jgi:SAM-dependent methyltransferase
VYPQPSLLPDRNPYDAYSSGDYFHAHDLSRKGEAGRQLARRAAELLGRKGSLLELGCGRGELLVAAREEGWQVAGVDMTASWAGSAADVPVEVAPVEAARSLERPESYDVIILAAILEHLYDPARCLDRCHRALAPGGLIFIDVPNECSLWTRAGNAYMRLRGKDWAINLSPTFPPFHVVGFCPASLRRLLDRCGFDVVELTSQRWQNELPRRPGVLAQIERIGADAVLTLGAALGMGAGLTCWARKK